MLKDLQYQTIGYEERKLHVTFPGRPYFTQFAQESDTTRLCVLR